MIIALFSLPLDYYFFFFLSARHPVCLLYVDRVRVW